MSRILDRGDHQETYRLMERCLLKMFFFYCVCRDEREKVFTQSAKSKHLRRSQVLSRLWKNGVSPEDDPSFPSPLPVAPSRQSKTSYEDREVITSNTRSIAALAAKKRGRATGQPTSLDRSFASTANRPLFRPQASEAPATTLTSSRLAQHNQLTEGVFGHDGLNGSDDNLSQNTLDKTSIHTDTSLPPLTGGDARYRNKKADPGEDSKKRGGYSQQVSLACCDHRMQSAQRFQCHSKCYQSTWEVILYVHMGIAVLLRLV